MSHPRRTAVITGGGGYLGAATAAHLQQSGYRVAIVDRNEAALVKAGADIGGDCLWRAVELTDPAAVEAMFSDLNQELGGISALINCAGIVGPNETVERYQTEQWEDVIKVNLTAIFYCCKYAIPYLLKTQAGRIVNIASVAGKEGNPRQSAYSASKAGVIALTKSLAKELATTGVTVNCISPAAIRSPMLMSSPPEFIKFATDKIPMGRLGEPGEVASMIAWMASEECSFTTGAIFDISGGRATY